MPKLPRITAKEAEKLLLDAGFIQIRSKGSHRIYRLAEIRVVIPFHPGKILHPKIIRQVIAAIQSAEDDIIINDDMSSDDSDELTNE